MRILETKDFGYRRVVRVVVNDTDPQWIHPDGRDAPPDHTGDTEDRTKIVCSDCRSNWRWQEFTFTNQELLVGLNKYGNPVHGGQEIISHRPKTWDELYREIDVRIDEHVQFGSAPRQSAPALASEVEPDFELVKATSPQLDNDGVIKQRFSVNRKGKPAQDFFVPLPGGITKKQARSDRDEKYQEAQAAILKAEQMETEAMALFN